MALELMITVDAQAPEVTLQTMTGKAVALAEMWQNGQHLLLIFLRHLG
jgi:hypothetical protein